MAQKEPREAEPDSVPEPSDAAALKRQQFASWVQGVQHKARVTKSVNPIASSTPPPLDSVPPPPIDSERPGVYHQIPEEMLRAARLQRAVKAAASAPPKSGPAASSSPVAAPSTPRALSSPMSAPPPPSSAPPPPSSSRPTKPPESSRITAPNPFDSPLREELPPDELTAVFSPPAELLARSGGQSAPGSAWEEPTQVVQASDVFGKLGSAPSHPPPSAGPSLEQLDFERKLVELATPVPAAAPRTRWLLWAIVAVLVGAGIAAFVEYSLHPMRSHSPSPAGAGLGVDRR